VAGRRTPQRRPLSGSRAGLALLACAAPITVGFVAPAGYLLVEASKRVAFAGVSAGLARETLNTVLLSAGATVLTVGLGLVLASGARLYARRVPSLWLRAAGFGYALPGTILAVALLGPLAGFDRMLAAVTRDLFGVTLGLLAGGTAVALIYAYTVRFLAISIGAAEAGLAKLPASQDEASRVLGQGTLGTFRLIHVPFAWTAVASGALLVFVDCMKELPATLLLRPLNVETLATHLYGEAARGTYEDGAVAALIIVLIGLLPLTLLSRLGPR
jgi:iron(III) transport system permease protein